MDRLPDELIFYIIDFLDIIDLTHLQQVSSGFLALARDSTIWKERCYRDSKADAIRRRQQQTGLQNARLESLRLAFEAYPQNTTSIDLDALQQATQSAGVKTELEAAFHHRFLANWEPDYPHERIDYYEEYIHRHAKISVGWIDVPGSSADMTVEVTGTTLSKISDHETCAVCSLDDGSVVIYDLSTNTPSKSILGHSGPGILTPGARNQDERHSIMTASGTTEAVTVGAEVHRSFHAVSNMVHEVDLNTLHTISTSHYSSTITALSSCDSARPLIVGANNTVHIYDAREKYDKKVDHNLRTELIAGPSLGKSQQHVVLSQPGPLSILHTPMDTDSIWVAGRFTSLLQYSLRSFPRLMSTFHSGARISSTTALPYPYIPRSLDLVRNPLVPLSTRIKAKESSGWTMICGGEYKGKGSLELYSMSSTDGAHDGSKYLNRQTAGGSKLLSVASHGGKLCSADGDGNIRWMERDGVSMVRSYNIKEALHSSEQMEDDSEAHGIFHNGTANSQGDIVQKIMPYSSKHSASKHSTEHLMLWTGDGRLAVLGFGPVNPIEADYFHDAVESQVESASDKSKRDAERQFSKAMRRALERNADEVRFMRGLGMS